jgi:hypothetical protein
MSNKTFRNPFIYLGAQEGVILFRKNGVEVRYPSTTKPQDQNIMGTMDFIRYALERQDWQFEWTERMYELEALQLEEEEEREKEAMRPQLRLLTGGRLEEEE